MMMTMLAEADMAKVEMAKWIPLFPATGMLLCGLLGCFRPLRKLTAAVTIAGVAGALVMSLVVLSGMGEVSEFGSHVVEGFRWIHVGRFAVDFNFYIDPLTMVMMVVVTGVGTLIAIYAAGYMAGDPGYFRFFAYISLFILMMTMLVMSDNLLGLYLGWEGVGLSSYLLIGFYYRKPSAVAAAKKAFIVNRVGDFGFALGLMSIFIVFGNLQYSQIIPQAQDMAGSLAGATAGGSGVWEALGQFIRGGAGPRALVLIIPFLLMLGAFGKSAQLPLHVWLPDAMEGPTPVSALIHAATMVTAGVYMIARLLPVFELSPYALPTVAVVGGVTAAFAATIALCQYDIKRVWAYSTISQLGYMFMGVGMMASVGAVFHLFTHAFFKALLFLTAGSVMHALAGQLDMRKMSGLRRKMPITAVLMLIGCLALAGVPFTSAYYSKDEILAGVLARSPVLGWVGIVTALITAFYTFRLWFRVFMGPQRYEMGREHHGYETDHAMDDKAHGPHEMPWVMNGPLVVLAIGALAAGWYLGPDGTNWMHEMVSHSSAAVTETTEQTEAIEHAHHLVGMVAGSGAIVMIILAGVFHWLRRDWTEKIAGAAGGVVRVLNRKYYIDEFYDWMIRLPLKGVAWICAGVDRHIVEGLMVNRVFGVGPRIVGRVVQVFQRGSLQGYAVTMGAGLLIIVWIIVMKAMGR